MNYQKMAANQIPDMEHTFTTQQQDTVNVAGWIVNNSLKFTRSEKIH